MTDKHTSALARPWGRDLERRRLSLILAGIVFSLLVGGLVYMGASRQVEREAVERLDAAARSAQYSLSARIKSYTDVVRGMAALFQTSDEMVSRAQFHSYVEALNMPSHFPAVEVVNFGHYVRDEDRERFVEAVRNDRGLDPRGYPGFDIRPPGRRPGYTVITYMEPFEPYAERHGFDMSANPSITPLFAHARDTARMFVSGLPLLVKKPVPHMALGLRMPVYQRGMPMDDINARRAAYRGSVGVALSMPLMVQSTLEEIGLRGVRMSLYTDVSRNPDQRTLAITPSDKLLFNDDGTLERPAVHPDDAARYVQTLLPVDFHGTVWKAQFRILKSDLYTDFDRWLPLGAALTGGLSTLLLFAYFSTLYWSRRTEIEQRALLDSVLDNVDAQVVMKGRDRRFLYVNAKAAEALGRDADAIIGRLDREVMPVSRADELWQQERAVFEDGERQVGQVAQRQADGAVHQMWTVRVPVQHDGQPGAVLALATDVTELHNLKAAADAASQAKSNFLSNMSHEIRTPMNSIIGMAHLALKSVTHPKQRDYLEKIHHSSQHLLGIINDILDFSKIEAGKMDLDLQDFGIEQLLKNVVNQLGQTAGAKDLTLEIEIDPALPRQLRGDPLRLEQVLLNFTSNAIKFSEHGPIELRVRPDGEQDGRLLVRFEVQDHGIGMAEHELAQLFQSFHQADPSTTRKYGGTGLGLVISKQLAELMSGTVGVLSAPGTGSTFWFTACLDRATTFLREQPAEVPGELLSLLRGAKLLLVEDNVFSQQVGKELLEEVGATVVVANNGREAIDLVLKQRFDAVLMDVQMPVMDGFETTRMMRSDPRMRDTLVIAMTANAGKEDRERCIDAGMNDFVTKPVAPDVLFALLGRWLRSRGVRRLEGEAERPPGPGPGAAPPPGLSTPLVSADPELLDLEALAQTFGGNPAKMRKYAFMFVESARDGLAELSEAVERQDLQRVGEVGHRLKSSARAVGAARFADLCGHLEALRPDSPVAEARAVVDQLFALHERLGGHVAREMDALAA